MSITFNVCGVSEVPRFSQASLTDIVSIGPQPDLSSFSPIPNVHRFEFDDICHVADASPTKAHVKQLIAIADSFLQCDKDVRVLYHCAAGISRSTAALFILLVRGGMTYQQAYQGILQVRGALAPNLLLIKYADILMNQGGKMLDYIADNRMNNREDAQEWVKANGYA